MRGSRFLMFVLLMLIAGLAGRGPAAQPPSPEPLSLADLTERLALAQHRGSWFRDRSTYFQKIYLERYKDRDDAGEYLNRIQRRLSTAEVSADATGEVIARMVSDTDDQLRPRQVRSSSRQVFGAPAFLELIFFPLYPEKVSLYEKTDLGTVALDGRPTRVLRFSPRPGASEPLVEGVFYVHPTTGQPIRLQVARLHRFDLLDKQLDKLLEFDYVLDYRTLPNDVTVPHRARGRGFSQISRHKGFFQFRFEEWGYRASPLYPDVVPYYEALQGFVDEERPGAPPDLLVDAGGETSSSRP